jgi:hypothetical protein
MTRKELEYVNKVLNRIKDPDEHVAKAIAYVNKDLAQFDSRRGQLRDQYESDYGW